MRVGFAQEVPLFSFPFFLDLLVDVYFIVDIWINFNTAFCKMVMLSRFAALYVSLTLKVSLFQGSQTGRSR